MQIAPAGAAHHVAIAELNRAAFGGEDECNLISRLRQDGLALVELVMLNEGIVGHVLFSRLAVEMDGQAVSAAALAPVCVRKDYQGRGIAAQLIQRGLAALREQGCQAVIVLGHPSYYPQFGFSAPLARKLAAPFNGHAFMALELVPNALAGRTGSVSYPSAFGVVQKSCDLHHSSSG
jgi:putative acetyltransferase